MFYSLLLYLSLFSFILHKMSHLSQKDENGVFHLFLNFLLLAGQSLSTPASSYPGTTVGTLI